MSIRRRRQCRPLLTAETATKATTEEGTEDIAQVDVSHIKAAAKPTSAEVGIYPRVTKLIIAGALFLVGQHLIGLVRFFELGFGLLIPRVHVGVIFFCHLSIGFFNFFLRGALADA